MTFKASIDFADMSDVNKAIQKEFEEMKEKSNAYDEIGLAENIEECLTSNNDYVRKIAQKIITLQKTKEE